MEKSNKFEPIIYELKKPSPILKKIKELYPRKHFRLCPECGNIFLATKKDTKIFCGVRCSGKSSGRRAKGNLELAHTRKKFGVEFVFED